MPGGAADALIFFLIVVPLALLFQLANLAIFFDVMRWPRGWTILRWGLLWGSVTACWVLLAAYSDHRTFRVIDPQYSHMRSPVGWAPRAHALQLTSQSTAHANAFPPSPKFHHRA